MTVLALAAALLAPPAAQGSAVAQEAPDGAHEHPAPRRVVDGLGSLFVHSRLVFAGRPDESEELRAVYVLPDRARWDFSSVSAGGRDRHRTVARFGERVVFRDGTTPPRDLEGGNREALRLGMELRRALFGWPTGFAWTATENGREALVHRHSCCEGEPVGRLVATLDANGRPVTITAWRGERVLEALTVSAWEVKAGRTSPRHLALSVGGKPVWTEEVLRHRRNERYLDSYFEVRPASSAEGARVMRVPVVAMTYRRVELAQGTGWKAAEAQARAARTAAEHELGSEGPALDALPTFELHPDGTPRAILVRLAEPTDDPPDGWTSVGRRDGALLLLPSLEGITPAHLALLADSLPAGRRAAPFARLLPKGAPVRVQLALALAPSR